MVVGPARRADAHGWQERPDTPEGDGFVRRDLLKAVRTALVSAADPDRAVGQQRYMKSAMPYYGLTAPQQRSILRPLLADSAYRIETRQEWEATVSAMWDGATHREERYAALALARHRSSRPWHDTGSLALCEHLVVTGAWWDLVDEIAVHLVGPALRADRAAGSPVMCRWAEAPDLWLRRAVLLSQLGAKRDTDTELLRAAILANVEGSRFGDQFFIRKAIGWALRDYAKTDPAWVRALVDEHGARLSGLSRREASKHL